MISTSITLPLEMLEAASTYATMSTKTKDYEVYFCSKSLTPITATGGLKLTPDKIFEQSGIADLVLIPALWRNPIPIIRKHPEITAWLKRQYDGQAIFVAAGTGVAFMALTGVLNKKPATTHWFYLEKLQHLFPKVEFKPNHLITRAGRVYCAGSVNSVADLMVHLIGSVHGESIAQRVEQQFSYEIRKSFKENHFADDHVTTHQDEVIVSLQDYIHHQFANEIPLKTLENLSGMNARTLNRRFQQATGSPPQQYIQKIRMDQAKDLLKNTNLGVAEIAHAVGYSDTNHFSRLFKRRYQLTPTAFRRSVRGKLFSLNDNIAG